MFLLIIARFSSMFLLVKSAFQFRRESSLLCVTLFRALFPYLFHFHRSEIASSTKFFPLNLRRLVRPQGYYQDLRSILMHPRSPTCVRQHKRARGSVSRKRKKRNADERCQRLDWMGPPPIPEWIRRERIARISSGAKRSPQERSYRESVSNLPYISINRSCAVNKRVFRDKEEDNKNIKYFCKVIRR